MELSARKKKILAVVVEEYIRTAEPVGSKAIAGTAGLEVSSATIRNELAELTNLGYLEQPHTSAGRIPTPQGYRIYVNELMERQKVSTEEAEQINQSLDQKIQQLDKLMEDVGKLTSTMTDYPAYALAAPTPATVTRFDFIYVDANTFIVVALLDNRTVKNKLMHLPFSVDQGLIETLATMFNANFTGLTEAQITGVLVASTERASGDTYGIVRAVAAFVIEILTETGTPNAYVSGAGHLLNHPEFHDPNRAGRVLQYLSDNEHLRQLPGTVDENGIRVIIGPENVAEELKDSSVVMATYNAGDGMQGLIGVVGPTRMDYSSVAAKLRYIADGLSRLLGSTDAPPTLNNKLIKGDDIVE
jgi:heat-inducible transcriptional repressor